MASSLLLVFNPALGLLACTSCLFYIVEHTESSFAFADALAILALVSFHFFEYRLRRWPNHSYRLALGGGFRSAGNR